jgi:hypothetical protein
MFSGIVDSRQSGADSMAKSTGAGVYPAPVYWVN